MKDASKAGNVLQAIAALGLTAAMATALALPSAAAPGPNDIVVDPQGEVSTLAAAQQALRGLGGTGPVTVWIKGGTYTVPLEFTAADRPNVTWRGMPGEEVVLTGAKDITGWQADTVNGLACWSTRAEGGYFTSLYHPTQLLSRPRYPAQGYLFVDHVEGAKLAYPEGTIPWDMTLAHLSFFAKEGDLRQFHALQDVTLRVLHYWKDEISNLVSYDGDTRELTWGRPAAMKVRADDRYFLENVFEELKEPGQWYLDRAASKLYYIPFEGEDMASTVLYAGVNERLLTIDGAENMTFQGITFKNTAWTMPDGGKAWGVEGMEFPQAAYDVKPCVSVTDSRGVRFEGCKFDRIGSTALKFGENTHNSGVTGCEFTQIGGSAVFIHGEYAAPNSGITVKDNLIAHYGRRFFCAIGVLNIHAHHIEITHNEIYDGYYTGISSGWVWGYSPNPTDHVYIENNLIYQIGQGWLSDMGGIYVLGIQENSVIRGNLIHDVAADPLQGGYGGWGIYLDEGSTGQLVEQNLVYSCGSQSFHQHYGKENIIRNNIFAFSKEGQIRVSRKEGHTGIILKKNIIVSCNQPIYTSVTKGKFIDDGNLYYDYIWQCLPVSVKGDGRPAGTFWKRFGKFFTERWCVPHMRCLGYYKNGVFRSPRFADVKNLDFTLLPNSPAITKLGFEVWDYTQAGRLAK